MAAPVVRSPLSEQISTALRELRDARAAGEYSREIVWQSLFDRLLDRWLQGHR
jgi:hypothetical protein